MVDPSSAGAGRAHRDELVVRAATAADHPAIVALAGSALGWRPEDPNAALFRWKHLANPFGPSPMWVAEADGELVAFRTFLRWEFRDGIGQPRQAVRAVDTATRPDHQGHGLFTRLTRHGLEAMADEGVGFVFNTPNDKSRPGYLKMGWQVLGRVPVAVSWPGPRAVARMARARVPAGKASLGSDTGLPAVEVLADSRAIDALLADQPAPDGLATARSVAFLRWRYAEGPLAYRAVLRTGRVEDGLVLFRLRRRGAAVEATVGDVLVPGGDPGLEADLLRQLRRTARPDYLIRVQRAALRSGCVRAPGQGPVLTWRAVTDRGEPPRLDRWDLRLGDIELF